MYARIENGKITDISINKQPSPNYYVLVEINERFMNDS